jgi:hypothetical protein
MMRSLAIAAAVLVTGAVRPAAAEISGDYLEARTCAVYTGPCFANSEVGLTGHQALMAWNIHEGDQDGVDLSGLSVVLSVRASDSLAIGGGMDVNPDPIKSVVLVDSRATAQQQAALVSFVTRHAGRMAGEIVRVESTPIDMKVDHADMIGELAAGKVANLRTRKLADGDCVCTNEEVYYPPLAQVENSAPAFTLEGGYSGRGLGSQWSIPDSRSAFLATFNY